MAGPTSSANMSMILTPPAQLTAAGPRWRAAATAATGIKALHNGHCVTLEPRPRYNMSYRTQCRGLWHGHCLYNTSKGHSGPEGEVRPARDSKKAWVRSGGIAQPDTKPLNNKNKTLLHTQASDRTPRQKRGGFFHWPKSQAISAEPNRGVSTGAGQKARFLPGR
jgi:hypothetical protein